MAHLVPLQAERLLTDGLHRANRLCQPLGRSQCGRLGATGRVVEPFEVVGYQTATSSCTLLTPHTLFELKKCPSTLPKDPLDKPRSNVL